MRCQGAPGTGAHVLWDRGGTHGGHRVHFETWFCHLGTPPGGGPGRTWSHPRRRPSRGGRCGSARCRCLDPEWQPSLDGQLGTRARGSGHRNCSGETGEAGHSAVAHPSCPAPSLLAAMRSWAGWPLAPVMALTHFPRWHPCTPDSTPAPPLLHLHPLYPLHPPRSCPPEACQPSTAPAEHTITDSIPAHDTAYLHTVCDAVWPCSCLSVSIPSPLPFVLPHPLHLPKPSHG